MDCIEPGDIVRLADTAYRMLVIGCADEVLQPNELQKTWSCVWECENSLYEEIFSGSDLILVRKERRRIPRGGDLQFPHNENYARQSHSHLRAPAPGH